MGRRIGILDVISKVGPDLITRCPRAQHADQVQQQPIGHRQRVAISAVVAIGPQQVPDRIAELLLDRLARQLFAELPVFIDRARDDPDVQALRALGVAEQVEAQAFFAAIGQPLVDGQPIALGL